MDIKGEFRDLTSENVNDIICCPEGLEVKGKGFQCDISPTLRWREKMIGSGMEGFVLHQDDFPTGFIEYMPSETAPYPIDAPGHATVMCFHWLPLNSRDETEHLKTEKKVLKYAVDRIKDTFEGVNVLAWDHPVHFPIKLFKEIGFSQVGSEEQVSLMWRPFSEDSEKPSLMGPNFEPLDLSNKGNLSVECGFSNRCPYSINDLNKVKKAVSDLDEDRIIFKKYRIDTREEAVKFSKHSWNWNWLFLNGREISHMKKTREELKGIIGEELEEIKRS